MDRPEHSLLLACARACSTEERAGRILSCLGNPIDWDYLFEKAGNHRMTSMLYWNLHKACREKVPPSILERLREHYLASSANNLLLINELLKILNLLEMEGISAIPFKGPILAHTLYEDPSLRQFGDLDILVNKKDVFRALRLMPAIGYEKIMDHSSPIEARILEHQNNYPIHKADHPVFVEIHWTMVPRYFGLPLSLENWWQRAKFISVETRQVQCLSNEDLLMGLCIHGCKHMWQSLTWIMDIARLLERHPDLNWDFVFKEYAHRDLRHILNISLIVAHDTLAAPVPADILQKARQDSSAAAMARKAQLHLFEAGSKLRERIFQFRLKPTLPGRIRSVLSYLFTPLLVDYKTSLPPFLYPLYRPLALFKRFFLSVFQRTSA